MRIGILSDSHDHVERTCEAVRILKANGADVLVHCGDLTTSKIVAECAVLPFYFVIGNHDADNVPALREAADEHKATCLDWVDEFSVGNKRVGVTHGHLTMALQPLLDSCPDYLLSGHSHLAHDRMSGTTRRKNPGALYRAAMYSVAILDVDADDVEFLDVPP
jgi:uncharacterized protein